MALIQKTANPKENKETITLIWFDPDIDKREDTKETQEKLRQINDYVIFYADLHLCITYIQNNEKDQIFLITSGEQAPQILPQIIDLRQVDSIFIFCTTIERYQHLTNEFSKMIGIYDSVAQLCKSIEEQVDLVDKQLQTFSIFDKHQQSTKDLSKQSGEFIWFQLFKCVILRLPRNEQAKKDMIDMCRSYYRGNKKELKLIDEFERDYRAENAIHWYTKDSFVYKLVNKALRTSDIDQLYQFWYFIGDLSESLAREHENLLGSEEEIVMLYRGAKLDIEEFDELNENQGKLISTNGYLSASRSRPAALAFAKKSTKRPDVIAVLFEIRCDLKQLGRSVRFADIAKQNDFASEQEVLFDLDAAFQIESIKKDGDVQLIKMNATNEAEIIAKYYIEETERETGEKSVAIVFGKLMCDLGEYDKSLKYFEKLSKEPNGEDLAWIEHNIGKALEFKGEWNTAHEYYQNAYKRMINAKPSRIEDSAIPLNHIGNILNSQGKYDEALEFYQRALKIREKFYPFGHVDIATSLNNIGAILESQGKYNEALDYYQRALQMFEKFYPFGHVDIATCLDNIGGILYNQGKYNETLDYYQRTLQIREKFYSSGHVDIAQSLNNIGVILYRQGKYDEALEYHQRALQMREKFYPSVHVDIATCLNNIGLIFDSQGKYDEALDYYQQALQIREKFYSSGHIDIAQSLSNIGNILYKQGKYNEALDNYQPARQMFEKFYPSGHVDIARSLNNIGNTLYNQGKYNEALNYHQRTLQMFEKFYPSGHVDIAHSLNNIGNIRYNQGKYNEALDYHQRALQIREKFYPSSHVDIAQSLRNIGYLYEQKKDSKKALDYYQQALAIYEKFLSSGHPSRIEVENYIHRASSSCVVM